MNPEFSGASYELCYFFNLGQKFYFIFSQHLNLITSLFIVLFCDLKKNTTFIQFFEDLNYFSLLFSYLEREVAGFNPIVNSFQGISFM